MKDFFFSSLPSSLFYHLFFPKIDKYSVNNSDSSVVKPIHRRSVSANDATNQRRILFVHRFSFRKPHTRTPSSSSQVSASETAIKTKEEILAADLVLRVDIIRGRNLSRDDEVYIKGVTLN